MAILAAFTGKRGSIPASMPEKMQKCNKMGIERGGNWAKSLLKSAEKVKPMPKIVQKCNKMGIE